MHIVCLLVPDMNLYINFHGTGPNVITVWLILFARFEILNLITLLSFKEIWHCTKSKQNKYSLLLVERRWRETKSRRPWWRRRWWREEERQEKEEENQGKIQWRWGIEQN